MGAKPSINLKGYTYGMIAKKADEENTATKEIGIIRKEDRTTRYEPSIYSYSSQISLR
jgi:hypothetical protein